jgi:hypothetical protein
MSWDVNFARRELSALHQTLETVNKRIREQKKGSALEALKLASSHLTTLLGKVA